MNEGTLTYDDLVSLYRGRASAVEQLSDSAISAIAIDTPLTAFLKEADANPSPRHVILTGNAGDGKSFAAVASGVRSFSITLDASAGGENRGTSPIDDLAGKLSAELRAGRRLLVAINRGQFERLDAHVGKGRDPALSEFMRAARAQATLRESWTDTESDVALVDLGLLDTSSAPILGAALEKVSAISVSPTSSAPASTAFRAAQASLRSDAVREYLSGVLRVARTNGHHATMRQLWSFLSFLATGARAGDSDRPVTLEDAVGARLFSDEAEGPLFDYSREWADPASIPQPHLTRLALLGRLAAEVRGGTPEFESNLALPPDSDLKGELLTRIAAVHRIVGAARPLSVHVDRFGLAVNKLRATRGWASMPNLTTPLLKGIYRVLSLWTGGNSFPAWQTLCFDSSRLPRATSVANAEIDPHSLRLALPRPSPWAEKALAGAWTPPYLWLAANSDATKAEMPRLRLTPRLFELLDTESSASSSPTRSDVLNLQRWLSEFPIERRRPSALRLGRRERPTPLEFTEDQLTQRTTLAWEGKS